MKKLSYLLVLFLVMGLGACSSDDNNGGGGSQTANIVGTWTFKEMKLAGSASGGLEMSAESVNVANDNKVTFRADGTLTGEGSGYTLRTKTKMMGFEFENEEHVDGFIDGNATWKIEGKFLVIVDDEDGEESRMEIETLNGSTLKLKVNEDMLDFDDDFDDDDDDDFDLGDFQMSGHILFKR